MKDLTFKDCVVRLTISDYEADLIAKAFNKRREVDKLYQGELSHVVFGDNQGVAFYLSEHEEKLKKGEGK